MDGLISIIGGDLLCERVGVTPAALVRISLTDATLTQWQQWSSEYHHAVRSNDPPALFALGRRIFAWLDETQWATEWATGAGPRLLEIAVNEVESATATALLDLPWEIMAQGQDFLASDPAQPFVVYRSIGKGRSSAPAQPAQRDLAALFMAASPRGQQELDYEAEEAAILQATEHLPCSWWSRRAAAPTSSKNVSPRMALLRSFISPVTAICCATARRVGRWRRHKASWR
jgi:hypothetical protein